MAKKTDQSHKKNWGAQIAHGVARKLELGNTNTPMDLARAIVRQFLDREIARQVADPGRWLEPAVGTGNFYMAVLEEAAGQGIDPWEMALRFDAVDIDAEAIGALKARLAESYGWTDSKIAQLPIFCASLVDWDGAGSYRVILTNPPYLAPKDWSDDATLRKAMLDKWQAAVPGMDPRADLFLYFFRWCHAHLEAGGASVFLCSDGWLDSDYGRALRGDFMGEDLTLEKVHAWPWASLFRDDTCPIITVTRKNTPGQNKGDTTLVVDDGSPLDAEDLPVYTTSRKAPVRQACLMTPADLREWLNEDRANRRGRIVMGPLLHGQVDDALARHSHHMAPFGAIADVTGFSWSVNDIERAGLLLAQPGATGKKDASTQAPDAGKWEGALPLFFQKQARVGKPVDYRQARAADTLGCRVALGADALSAKIRKGGARVGGAWIGMAIDRFPLAFFQAGGGREPWIGVSKYTHASLVDKEGRVDDEHQGALLCALATNTLAILSMEMRLKEGTRKTLRTNENGYAKEITRKALCEILVPDWRQWDQDTLEGILALQGVRAVKNLHRLDAAVSDPDWVALDDAIGAACGIDANEMARLRALSVAVYWRRMRHVLEYGPAMDRLEAAGVQI